MNYYCEWSCSHYPLKTGWHPTYNTVSGKSIPYHPYTTPSYSIVSQTNHTHMYILYNDGVVLVWMIEYRHPFSCSKYCMSGVIISSKDNDYKIIHSSNSFISSEANCWMLYVSVRISTICWYYSCCLSCMYVHSMMYSSTISYILYGWAMR